MVIDNFRVQIQKELLGKVIIFIALWFDKNNLFSVFKEFTCLN